MYVDVENARLWVEQDGSGPAVLFLHGGLGDSRLWEPVTERLRDSFRCVRYDFRFFGRSEGPNEEWSPSDDSVAVLDALDIERAAVVGLSMGGRVALEIALTHPERVSALVHVAGAVEPFELDGYDPGDTRESEMLADFGVWAPLGIEDGYRDLWLATPSDTPEDRRADVLLDDLTVPTLVVIAKHDPAVFRELAERIPATRRVEIDSDHYVTLREPDAVARLIREFL
ncbi:MAG TPA: alpha/beta fold hydrolase [Gaiellaceae bacterium]